MQIKALGTQPIQTVICISRRLVSLVLLCFGLKLVSCDRLCLHSLRCVSICLCSQSGIYVLHDIQDIFSLFTQVFSVDLE